MSAAEILKLIETVSPDDTAKLDEIDSYVWCWLKNKTYSMHARNIQGKLVVWYETTDGRELIFPAEYTRSRNDLKLIRPESFYEMTSWRVTTGMVYECGLELFDHELKFLSWVLPSEELTELHAIIQAIEWERKNALQA